MICIHSSYEAIGLEHMFLEVCPLMLGLHSRIFPRVMEFLWVVFDRIHLALEYM